MKVIKRWGKYVGSKIKSKLSIILYKASPWSGFCLSHQLMKLTVSSLRIGFCILIVSVNLGPVNLSAEKQIISFQRIFCYT